MSDDVFLRKDTFDETMKRIEAMMSASEARNTTSRIPTIRERLLKRRKPYSFFWDTFLPNFALYSSLTAFVLSCIGLALTLLKLANR